MTSSDPTPAAVSDLAGLRVWLDEQIAYARQRRDGEEHAPGFQYWRGRTQSLHTVRDRLPAPAPPGGDGCGAAVEVADGLAAWRRRFLSQRDRSRLLLSGEVLENLLSDLARWSRQLRGDTPPPPADLRTPRERAIHVVARELGDVADADTAIRVADALVAHGLIATTEEDR